MACTSFMKPKVVHEYHEGQEADQRFKSAVKTILSVTQAEMKEREKKYQGERALKPKRGPKPKPKTFAVRAHGSDD